MSNGVGHQHETTRGIKVSKLSILFLVVRIAVFFCVGLVLVEEIDIGMNAHEM